MKKELQKIGFGGGCHWCTEAVFESLKGVTKVEPGFIASTGKFSNFSEAVIVHFEESVSLRRLIEIHLYTHRSTSAHSMRDKYRSAVYTFNENQELEARKIMEELKNEFRGKLVTKVCPFHVFKPSAEEFHNYYRSDPQKPFCKTYIEPKLKFLLEEFSEELKQE